MQAVCGTLMRSSMEEVDAAVPVAHDGDVHGGEDIHGMDLVEHECDDMGSDDRGEFINSCEGPDLEQPSVDNTVLPPDGVMISEEIEDGARTIASEVVDGDEGSTHGIQEDGDHPEPDVDVSVEHEDVPPPWARFTRICPITGFVYLDGRVQCRIRHGNPKNKVSVTCYKHTGCKLIINGSRYPGDDVIYSWLFEFPEDVPGMTIAERHAARDRHIEVAKARWSAPIGT